MAQTDQQDRSYAVGVQLFDRIRESGAVYVDKSAYIYKMVTTPVVNFVLSRPRRSGKSLQVDTLRCYFEGHKELFEGLAIYDMEKEWKKHPVRLDLSNGKYFEKELVHGTINNILKWQEKAFGIAEPEEPMNYDARLTNFIHAAYDQSSDKVVVLIDEYDAPMLDYVGSADTLGIAFGNLHWGKDGRRCRHQCRGANHRRVYGHSPEGARCHLYPGVEIRQDCRGGHPPKTMPCASPWTSTLSGPSG